MPNAILFRPPSYYCYVDACSQDTGHLGNQLTEEVDFHRPANLWKLYNSMCYIGS